MNANIMKTQIRIKFQNHLFMRSIFCLKTDFFKAFQDVNIMKTHIFPKMMYDLKGHPWS